MYCGIVVLCIVVHSTASTKNRPSSNDLFGIPLNWLPWPKICAVVEDPHGSLHELDWKQRAGLQIYQFSYLSSKIIFTRMASPFSLSCLLAEMALYWYCVRLLIHMPTLSAPWEGKGAAFFSQEILSAIWSDLILWATCNADRKGQNLLQVLFFTKLRKSFLLDPWDSRVKR